MRDRCGRIHRVGEPTRTFFFSSVEILDAEGGRVMMKILAIHVVIRSGRTPTCLDQSFRGQTVHHVGSTTETTNHDPTLRLVRPQRVSENKALTFNNAGHLTHPGPSHVAQTTCSTESSHKQTSQAQRGMKVQVVQRQIYKESRYNICILVHTKTLTRVCSQQGIRECSPCKKELIKK